MDYKLTLVFLGTEMDSEKSMVAVANAVSFVHSGLVELGIFGGIITKKTPKNVLKQQKTRAKTCFLTSLTGTTSLTSLLSTVTINNISTTVLSVLKEKVTFVICASSDTRCFRHGGSNRNVKKSVITCSSVQT